MFEPFDINVSSRALNILHTLIWGPKPSAFNPTCCQLGPAATGHKTSAEGETCVWTLVFSPSAKRHHNDCAVVLWTIMKSLEKKRSTQAVVTRTISVARATSVHPCHRIQNVYWKREIFVCTQVTEPQYYWWM